VLVINAAVRFFQKSCERFQGTSAYFLHRGFELPPILAFDGQAVPGGIDTPAIAIYPGNHRSAPLLCVMAQRSEDPDRVHLAWRQDLGYGLGQPVPP
jgi:hypothetical protein